MTTGTELVKAEEAIHAMEPVIIDITDKAKQLAHINDDKSFQEADRFLVEIKRTQKRLDDDRKKFTGPLDLAKKQIMDAYRPKAQMLSEAEMILKGATRKWFIAEQDRKRKEEERLREEERKRQEDEQLAKAAELEKNGNKTLANAELEKPIVDSKPKVSTSFDSGASYGRKVWKAEVTDLDAFLKGIIEEKVSSEFIDINTGKMNRVVQAMKGKISWPGVKVVEDVVMGVRR